MFVRVHTLRERLARRGLRDDRGMTGVEYALIISLIAAGIVGVVAILGSVLGSGYTDAADAVPASGASAPQTPGESPEGETPADTGSGTGGTGGGTGGAPVAPSSDAPDAPGDTSGTREGGSEDAGAGQKTGDDKKPTEGEKVEDAKADGGEKQPEAPKCIGQQTYDEKSNTCLVPKCEWEAKVYNAGTGRCDEMVKWSKCQAKGLAYDEKTNSCYKCEAKTPYFNSSTVACDAQVTCSSTQLPTQWNQCQAPVYLGAQWSGQPEGSTATYAAFPDKSWPYLTEPYSAKVIDAQVSSTGWDDISDVPAPSFGDDSITITAPVGHAWGRVTVTYTVEITYPWNGETRTATTTSTINTFLTPA